MAKRCILGEKSSCRNGGSKENASGQDQGRYEEYLAVLCENFPPLQADRYETERSPSPFPEQRYFETKRNKPNLPLQEQSNKANVKKDWYEMVEEEEMQEKCKNFYKERQDVPQRIRDVRAWREDVKRRQKKTSSRDTWGTLYKEEEMRNEVRGKVYAVARYKGDPSRDKNYGQDCAESLEDMRLSNGVVTSTPSKEHTGSIRNGTDEKARSKQPTMFETCPAVLKRRQKQIDYGKNTMGYHCYTSAVRKMHRTKGDPRTPDKHIKYSRNSWDMQIKLWRKQLHNWDPPSNDPANESCDLDFDLSSEISFDTSETSSSVPASSSSPDCLTQDMDIGYGSSPFQDVNVTDNTLPEGYNSKQLATAEKSMEDGFCDASDLEIYYSEEECTYLEV